MPGKLIGQINASPWTPVQNEDAIKAARRRRETLAMLVSFLRGDIMTVGTANDRVDIKALDPLPGMAWRAWELRATVQNPHTRIFGVFASGQDFVAQSVMAKAQLSPAAQTNAANVAYTQSTTALGQTIMQFKGRPNAAALGGDELNYERPDF
jgi:hypothetical protein